MTENPIGPRTAELVDWYLAFYVRAASAYVLAVACDVDLGAGTCWVLRVPNPVTDRLTRSVTR